MPKKRRPTNTFRIKFLSDEVRLFMRIYITYLDIINNSFIVNRKSPPTLYFWVQPIFLEKALPYCSDERSCYAIMASTSTSIGRHRVFASTIKYSEQLSYTFGTRHFNAVTVVSRAPLTAIWSLMYCHDDCHEPFRLRALRFKLDHLRLGVGS